MRFFLISSLLFCLGISAIAQDTCQYTIAFQLQDEKGKTIRQLLPENYQGHKYTHTTVQDYKYNGAYHIFTLIRLTSASCKHSFTIQKDGRTALLTFLFSKNKQSDTIPYPVTLYSSAQTFFDGTKDLRKYRHNSINSIHQGTLLPQIGDFSEYSLRQTTYKVAIFHDGQGEVDSLSKLIFQEVKEGLHFYALNHKTIEELQALSRQLNNKNHVRIGLDCQLGMYNVAHFGHWQCKAKESVSKATIDSFLEQKNYIRLDRVLGIDIIQSPRLDFDHDLYLLRSSDLFERVEPDFWYPTLIAPNPYNKQNPSPILIGQPAIEYITIQPKTLGNRPFVTKNAGSFYLLENHSFRYPIGIVHQIEPEYSYHPYPDSIYQYAKFIREELPKKYLQREKIGYCKKPLFPKKSYHYFTITIYKYNHKPTIICSSHHPRDLKPYIKKVKLLLKNLNQW